MDGNLHANHHVKNNMDFITSLKSTFFHVVELFISLGVAAVVLHYVLPFLGLDTESATAIQTAIAGLSVNAVLKFARAYADSPLKDYVNK